MTRERQEQDPSQAALQALVEEARAGSDATPRGALPDRVEAPLFARIEREAAANSALTAHRGPSGRWLLLGGFAAAAAAAMIVQAPARVDSSAAIAAPRSASAGDLSLQNGPGDVRVDGVKVTSGARASRGATIDTRGAKAVFDAPGRVLWLVEDESSVRVERAGAAGAPVVLALTRGAIEAQVAPVPSGEAFAIDIGGVRVAVHGTHLRVARDGGHVVVDLSEGMVSLGAPPKTGSTYGTLVTAPAHIEFDASALASSLTVDHLASAVRAAADLSSVDVASPAPASPVSPASRRPHDDRPPPPPARPASPSAPRPATAPKNANAERDIETAVLACAAAEPRSSEVEVTVHSTIALQLNEDGSVQLARFDPPLAPEIQACATRAIFAARFSDSAEHLIHVTF